MTLLNFSGSIPFLPFHMTLLGNVILFSEITVVATILATLRSLVKIESPVLVTSDRADLTDSRD